MEIEFIIPVEVNRLFFALMVDEITSKNRSKFTSYLPKMLKEYQFWMKGSEKLSEANPAINRAVLLEDNIVLK